MIICSGGKVMLSGGEVELQSELTCVMSKMVKDGLVDKESAQIMMDLAFMSDDELDEAAKEAVASMITMSALANVMEKLSGGKQKNDD